MARREFRVSLRFCAPEIFCLAQGITPVMGGPGADSPCQGEMSRSDRGGRVGEYGHAVSILSRPPAILKVNCPEGAREGGLGHWFLSHRWERNSPPAGGEISLCTTSSIRILPPHPSGLRPVTFPPGGRLREKRRNTVSHKILLPTFLLRKVGGGEHPRTDLKFSLMEKAA